MDKELLDKIAQKNILKSIIGKGKSFKVAYKVKERQKGIFGLFKKKVSVDKEEEFVLREPTLAVLDRASEVLLDMYDSEGAGSGEGNPVEEYKIVNNDARLMARVLAILVLGEAYYSVEGGDDKELDRLEELFYKTIKPSQCEMIATYINATSNLVDFVGSMRLMKMSLTTTPTVRVE